MSEDEKVYIDTDFLDEELYEDMFDEDEYDDEEQELLDEGFSFDDEEIEDDNDFYDQFGPLDD